MISTEDCEFIKKFEKANSEEKQLILTKEGHQVDSPHTLSAHLCLSIYCAHSSQTMADITQSEGALRCLNHKIFTITSYESFDRFHPSFLHMLL